MSDVLERLKTALADRCAIEREIGSGGMATVYLAEDLQGPRDSSPWLKADRTVRSRHSWHGTGQAMSVERTFTTAAWQKRPTPTTGQATLTRRWRCTSAGCAALRSRAATTSMCGILTSSAASESCTSHSTTARRRWSTTAGSSNAGRTPIPSCSRRSRRRGKRWCG